MDGATVLVVGLGDLGGRIAELLAANPRIGTLLGCGRAGPAGTACMAQTALIAETLDGPGRVRHVATDLADQGAVEQALREHAPDVVVFTASRHSWWRAPFAARTVPYGVWLPLQLQLLGTFMRAHRAAGSRAHVISLPHPDATGPVLAATHLAPDVGAGNVAEVAAKLRLLTAREIGCERADVDVRLVLHHAAERLAFEVFALDGPRAAGVATPPYLAHVTAYGDLVPPDVVDRLLRQSYPLRSGAGSHQLTAVTATRLVDALLGEEPQHLHAPGPGGLAGGYPVLVSSHGIELDLPETISASQAQVVNEQAAAFDGIAAITPEGTICFTEAAAAAAGDVLRLTLTDVPVPALDAAADRLSAALSTLTQPV